MNRRSLRPWAILCSCLALGACLIDVRQPEERPAPGREGLGPAGPEDGLDPELEALRAAADARIAAAPSVSRVGDAAADHDHDQDHADHDHDHDHGDHDHEPMDAAGGADR